MGKYFERLLAMTVVVLMSTSVARAETVAVNCDGGQRLQATIDQARPGDTIVVSGFCAENVVIREEAMRITLDGQGAATIHGRLPGPPTIVVLGRGITIRGFTITGGRAGVTVIRGGTAVIDSNTIKETGIGGQPGSGDGVNIAQGGSYAQIINNTIQFNAVAGIRVMEASFARIGFLDPADPVLRGNVIQNNGAVGVLLDRSSGASIAGNTISGNAGPGVSVGGASYALLAANRVDANSSNGVTVRQNSAVQLGGGAGLLDPPNDTEVRNQGFGISCALNSSVDGRLATLTGTAGALSMDSSCASNLVAVTGLNVSPPTVRVGSSFSVTLSGTNLTDQTFFDVRFRAPGSTFDQEASNWQTGTSRTPTIPTGTPTGVWTFTGVRAHQDAADHSGSFTPISVILTVAP